MLGAWFCSWKCWVRVSYNGCVTSEGPVTSVNCVIPERRVISEGCVVIYVEHVTPVGQVTPRGVSPLQRMCHPCL